jgi:hypothetical protein
VLQTQGRSCKAIKIIALHEQLTLTNRNSKKRPSIFIRIVKILFFPKKFYFFRKSSIFSEKILFFPKKFYFFRKNSIFSEKNLFFPKKIYFFRKNSNFSVKNSIIIRVKNGKFKGSKKIRKRHAVLGPPFKSIIKKCPIYQWS